MFDFLTVAYDSYLETLYTIDFFAVSFYSKLTQFLQIIP